MRFSFSLRALFSWLKVLCFAHDIFIEGERGDVLAWNLKGKVGASFFYSLGYFLGAVFTF